MDNGSFAYLNNRSPSTRPVIIGGILVLVIAGLGAVIAGIVAVSRDDAALPASSATVTVTAQPDTGEERPEPTGGDVPAPGTYEGQLSSVADDETAGARWEAVAMFSGAHGMIVYPTTSCTVRIDRIDAAEHWQSTPLTSQCSGEGSWQVVRLPGDILELAFVSPEGHRLVEGTLSLATDPEDTSSVR